MNDVHSKAETKMTNQIKKKKNNASENTPNRAIDAKMIPVSALCSELPANLSFSVISHQVGLLLIFYEESV